MYLSWSFLSALMWIQWTPLICAPWFLPALATVVLIKPNITLPLLLTGDFEKALVERRQWKWAILPAVVLLLSLIWYPHWPAVWYKQVRTYQGISPPLLSMPLGPIVILSMLNWRDRRAWLLVIFALMPQRMVYDQLPLLLIANSRRQLWILVAASWISLAIFLRSNGWGSVPLGWQNFLLATLYLPAVAMIIWPILRERIKEFAHLSRSSRS